jgi:hypothetical protein
MIIEKANLMIAIVQTMGIIVLFCIAFAGVIIGWSKIEKKIEKFLNG